MARTPAKERHIVLDWSEVKHKFIDGVEKGEPWPTQPQMGDRFAQMHKSPYQKNSWEGGSGADTLGWLREGFKAKEFAHAAEYVQTGVRRRPTYDMYEGEPDAGRLLSGADEIFFTSAKRVSKPGIRVMIEFCFAAGVNNDTIKKYGAFCAGLMNALEVSGFDLTVDLWIPLDNLMSDDRGTRTNVMMRVKRENELSDFTEWSAIFAPTGFRQLGFTALCMAADKIGKRTSYGLGNTIGGKTWDIDYDPDNSLLKITVDQRGYGTFDPKVLTQKAIKAKLIDDPDEFKGHH